MEHIAQNTNIQTFKLIYKYYTEHTKAQNTIEQFEIYKHHKTQKNKIFNAQIICNDHILYDTIK
jgi:hypothetical protein